MPGKDHWTEAEKDRLLLLREQYSHLPWAQFHKVSQHSLLQVIWRVSIARLPYQCFLTDLSISSAFS
jgi:hypothetical protein